MIAWHCQFFIKTPPVFHNSRLTQRWALGCSMATVGVVATLSPNVPPVPDKLGVRPVTHTECFHRAHVHTHIAHIQ